MEQIIPREFDAARLLKVHDLIAAQMRNGVPMNMPRSVQYIASAPVPADVMPARPKAPAIPVKLRGGGERDALALEVTDDGVIVTTDEMLSVDAMVETEFSDPWDSDRCFRVFGEVSHSTFLIGSGGQALPAAQIRFFGLDEDGRALLRDFVSAHFIPRGLEVS